MANNSTRTQRLQKFPETTCSGHQPVQLPRFKLIAPAVLLPSCGFIYLAYLADVDNKQTNKQPNKRPNFNLLEEGKIASHLY